MNDDGRTESVGRPTRRRLLRGAGAGLAATVGGAGVAAGQTTESDDDVPRITVPGVIIEQPAYDQTVTGFWIHLSREIDPVEASIADQCDYVDWGDEDTQAFDAFLIDRTADPEQQRITLYLEDDTEVTPGTLFIVNERHPCPSGYLGVELERVGADLAQIWTDDVGGGTATPNGGGGVAPDTDVTGPGFGAVGGLAGLLGAGWLARRLDDGDD